MSKNTLLIMPSLLKERTALFTNTDDKLLYPEIKAAQDMYILPLLGSTLFSALQVKIAAGTVTGYYETLMDDYLVDALINYVLSELPDSLSYQLTNKGVVKRSGDNSEVASYSDLYAAHSKYRARAEHYSKRCRLYLVQNATAHFPEYAQSVPGVDVISPDATSFTSPIYLGFERIEIRPDRNPGYNSNDPYIL